MKGGNPDNPNTVDAISGATITSQALGKGINLWVKYYEPYLKTVAKAAVKASVAVPAADGTEAMTTNTEEE